jgi:HAE1 family hydrophobic/amphiphilic exporter-1
VLSLFVRRRVFALMLNLAVVVIGLICYFTLGVDLYPKIAFPIVTVGIQMPGAPPQVMEQQVTRVVEDAVAVIGGLDHITSTSMSGYSSVVIQFQLSKDINVATQEVRDKVNAQINNLPSEIQTPVIDKVDQNSQPVISVVMSGRDMRTLTQIAKDQITDPLQSVDGVGQVNLMGAETRQINLDLDYKKMYAYGVSVTDVKNAVSQQNKEAGGGSIRSPLFDYQMRTMGLLTSPEQFNDIVVKVVDNIPILLKNVGRAYDGVADITSVSRLDDQMALTLQVVKTSDANTVKVVEGVKARVAEIEKSLPPGVKLRLAADQSVFIQESVDEIVQHLVLGSLLASLMVLVFLGDLRSTVIATIAIPCSVIGGFIVMAIFGYTLNQISLLAMALVVGIVIDDAVVVLEEIHRLMDEEDLSPFDAACKGIQSIGFAVMATTLSLVVIFLPIAFMPGILGAYFSSYGVIMAATIMISMFVSFTFTPMLCAVLLRHKKGVKTKSWFYDLFFDRPYTWLLHFTLRFRFLVILLCAGVAVWGWFALQHTGKDFVQDQDDNTVTVTVKLPAGRSIAVNDEVVRGIAAAIRKRVPYVDYTLYYLGGDASSGADTTKATITVQMEEYADRALHKPVYTTFDAQVKCREILRAYPTLRSSVTVGSGGQADFQCVISGPSLDVLSKSSDRLMADLRKHAGFVDVDTDLDLGAPEIRVYIQRERAARLGVNFYDAASTVQALIGGVKVSSYYEGKDRYDVKVRLRPSQRERATVIDYLTVPTSSGTLVPMSNVARVEWGLAPTSIRHYNRQRQVTVSANLVGLPLQSAMSFGQDLVKTMGLGADYHVQWSGNGQYMTQMLLVFLAAFLVSVVFMYMVLASQFESLVDPLIILATLPLCFPFALFSLDVTHNTLNIFSTLGLFLLVGVVKKNAIFQIDTTKALIAEGRALYEAIIEANRIRLRPIVMTTVTLVVAMLPVAAAGANGWTRAPMAIVIVGGQSLSLILTLLVIPALYSYVHDFWGKKYRAERTAKTESEAPRPTGSATVAIAREGGPTRRLSRVEGSTATLPRVEEERDPDDVFGGDGGS